MLPLSCSARYRPFMLTADAGQCAPLPAAPPSMLVRLAAHRPTVLPLLGTTLLFLAACAGDPAAPKEQTTTTTVVEQRGEIAERGEFAPGTGGHPTGTHFIGIPLGRRPHGVAVGPRGLFCVSQIDGNSVS